MASNLHLDHRIAIAAGFVCLGLSASISSAVGLTLYGDGALYFLEILLERGPLVPNQRIGAAIPQLPLLLAMGVTDQVTILRYVFCFGYGLLSFVSAFICWLVVRGRKPELMLFPALFLAANQINFSGVSELFLCLYLGWPFLLLACLDHSGAKVTAFGVALAPLLFFLHPLAFLLLLFLGLVLHLLAWTGGQESRSWTRLAALFMGLGLLRLLWSVLGTNAYERSYLQSESAAYYLFPDSTIQVGLLCAILLLGVAIAGRFSRLPSTALQSDAHPGSGKWAGGVQEHRLRRLFITSWLLWLLAALTAALGLAVAAEIHFGGGVKLKSAVVFPLALALMAIAVVVARQPRVQRQGATWASYFLLITLVATVIGLSKAHAWHRATHDLAGAMATSPSACIRFGPDEPHALQPAHMSPVDNWTAPINALIFQT